MLPATGRDRGQFVALPGLINERKVLGMGLQEEVEGIDDRHLGHQVIFSMELPGRLRKDQTAR